HQRPPRRRPGRTPGRQPNRRARKGVDNGRASYGAIESARRPPVTHPHSTRAPKGTFLLCATRGHSYCALTSEPSQGLINGQGEVQILEDPAASGLQHESAPAILADDVRVVAD